MLQIFLIFLCCVPIPSAVVLKGGEWDCRCECSCVLQCECCECGYVEPPRPPSKAMPPSLDPALKLELLKEPLRLV